MPTINPEKYNGWTNHATWCVHLHITSSYEWQKQWEDRAKELLKTAGLIPQVKREIWNKKQGPVFILADNLKDWVENTIDEPIAGDNRMSVSLLKDLALSALGDVNWGEIAKAFLAD